MALFGTFKIGPFMAFFQQNQLFYGQYIILSIQNKFLGVIDYTESDFEAKSFKKIFEHGKLCSKAKIFKGQNIPRGATMFSCFDEFNNAEEYPIKP